MEEMNEMTKDKICRYCGVDLIPLENIDKSRIYRSDWWCKDCRRVYQRNYMRKQRENFRMIYIMWAGERALYVGSSTNKYRIMYHFSKNSQLRFTKEDWQRLGLDRITYCEFDGNEIEVIRQMEHIIIRELNPLLNKVKNYIDRTMFDFQHEVIDKITRYKYIRAIYDKDYWIDRWREYPIEKLME